MEGQAVSAKESDMTGILDKFHVDHGIHGVKVIARSRELTNGCFSDSEVDSAIELLKTDLDACGREMKRLLVIDHRGALFEGWPSARDDQLA